MKKNRSLTVVIAVFVIMTLMVWFTPDSEYSMSERRYLAGFPSADKTFTDKFDTYCADQFPLRDGFRRIKAYVSRYLFLRADNNGLYAYGDHLSKMDYPLNEDMTEYFRKVIKGLGGKFTSSNRVVFSVVPDKNAYSDRPYIDADELGRKLFQNSYLSITDLLDENDYYYGDSHWKNECIADVAERILSSFNRKLKGEYELRFTEADFNGVFKGQSMLECGEDRISYMYSVDFDDVSVKDHQGKEMALFDFGKLNGKDPYEFYLGGVQPYIDITNPHVNDGSELIVFRDSYGSSIVPYFVNSYSRIRVVDLRYMSSAVIDQFIEFDSQDILLLYSTTVIASPLSLK